MMLLASAGGNINLRAAQVNAQGALSTTTTTGNVNIEAGQSSESLAEARQVKSRGLASSQTTTTRTSSASTNAQASELGGQSVAISSGQDSRISGSNVIADKDLSINAGGNVSIEAAQNTSRQSSFSQTTRSGLMSSGLSVTVGKQQQSLDQQNTQTTAAASTVGSTGGNVSITAGQTFTQTGSDVLTPAGNIDITAQTVNIQEARETSSQGTEQKFKQSGVTLAITSPVISALQTASSQLQAAGNTSSSRMQGLAAANAAMNLKQGADAVKAGQGQVPTGNKNPDGTPEMVDGNAADKAGGIGISLSLGSSSSQSRQASSADTARGSTITAGGNVNISATGAGQDSDLTIEGSKVQAGQTTSLQAEGNINLLAAANTRQEQSSQSSKSGSIGVSGQLGAGSAGVGVTASAARGSGQGAGNGVSYTNTQISGNSVNLNSGADTNLKGAVVTANQATATVGGNLSIESLQDSNQYKEKSKSAGGSVTIGPTPGGSINLGKTSINSNFNSVGEQSAIHAGDSGFQVDVKGDTSLTGGQITSTQSAIDQNKNNFTTGGTLTTTDLQNQASYSAKSVSVGLSAGTPKPGSSVSAGLSGVGIGSDKGSASSITTAGISAIAGNTAARTDDKETGIRQIFDANKVKKEIDAQVTITQEFNKQAGKAITDYADSQRKALQEQAKNAATPEDRAQAEQAIKDVNMQERALNILTSALTGMAGSVITKEALSTAAEKMRDLMIEDSIKFAGVVDSTGTPLFSNESGQSAGVNGDGFKTAGARANLDLLCGVGGVRCAFMRTADGAIDRDKPVKFLGDYDEFKKSPDGQKMLSAPFGGLQGGDRTLFGQLYEKGSWQDKLLEAFAGPHDLIGGQKPGLYDSQGNIKQGMSSAEEKARDLWSGLALVPAAPLAASQLPPEVWKALGILLRGGL